jgi:uncharacterized membrane protein
MNGSDNTKLYSILSYIGILFLVGLIAEPGNSKARFHYNQGIVLCIAEVVLGILVAILSGIIFAISWQLYWLTGIISFIFWAGCIALSIIGIINANNGEEKRLPVIGNINILK